MASQDPGASEGALIGRRFRLLARLGKGGFGTVWRAQHEHLGRDVALKLLNTDIATDEDARRRFLKEVEATTAFVHKYAVVLREFGQEPSGQLFFSMDLVEGRTLRAVLDAEGPLAPARANRLAAQALEVMEEAHAAGLVHRDLKPQNLMLTRGRDGQEEVRVLDFGIAKAMSTAHKNTSGLTLTGMTVGTLHYMSPEQAQGKRLDGRSDLYSLGVVLYEALSGKLPIEADPDAEDTKQSLLYRLVAAPPDDLARAAPGVPPALARVVMQALEKAPGDRWPYATAFRDALLAAVPEAASRTSGRLRPSQDTLASDGATTRPGNGGPPSCPSSPSADRTGSLPTGVAALAGTALRALEQDGEFELLEDAGPAPELLPARVVPSHAASKEVEGRGSPENKFTHVTRLPTPYVDPKNGEFPFEAFCEECQKARPFRVIGSYSFSSFLSATEDEDSDDRRLLRLLVAFLFLLYFRIRARPKGNLTFAECLYEKSHQRRRQRRRELLYCHGCAAAWEARIRKTDEAGRLHSSAVCPRCGQGYWVTVSAKAF